MERLGKGECNASRESDAGVLEPLGQGAKRCDYSIEM